MKTRHLAALALALFLSSTALGDDSLVPNDLVALKAHVGQTVEIKGTPTGAGKSPSGNIVFLNFDKKAHSALVVVFFTTGDKAGSVKSDDELKPFVGKTITIKGELNAFKDDVQITLKSVDDIHVVE